jgi:4-amino-4-deoxy-L-arabinose transferase-like glycosyltransferase
VGAEYAVSAQRFFALLTVIVLLGLALRTLFPAADPPWKTTVGVVWHDEGAWVHNARNKALWGAWRVDEWNPVFIAPVFTALEYGSFAAFGVGVRQARLVVEMAGWLSVLLLAFGVRRIAGDRAALVAGALVATNYVYVMYDRAAIMEGLMVAFIVASWYCSARAEQEPAWGAAAGVLAVAAYFTKAAAAFYIAALGLAALWSLVWPRADLPAEAGRHTSDEDLPTEAANHTTGGVSERNVWLPPLGGRERTAALWTIGGLAVALGIAAALFVLPNWSEYRFYNWQMSVTRKPSYTLKAIVDRLSWFPILHDTFTRMWFVLLLGLLAAWGIVVRWRIVATAERLLLLWLSVGTAEMLVHDVGNERRFVILIPVLIALAATLLGRGEGLLPDEVRSVPRSRIWLAAPVLLYTAYVVCGPIMRLPYLYQVRPAVRLSAAAAVVLSALVVLMWVRLTDALVRVRWSGTVTAMITAALVVGNLVEYGQWATLRTYKNYYASVELGNMLPPGTLVQGKLANGLSLENRIRPLFIGHGFGNFADRFDRDDVRYILTYTEPEIGYEGSQIRDVLDASPGWRIIMTFDVAETPSGHDRAALIEKRARH